MSKIIAVTVIIAITIFALTTGFVGNNGVQSQLVDMSKSSANMLEKIGDEIDSAI